MYIKLKALSLQILDYISGFMNSNFDDSKTSQQLAV